MKTKIRNEYSTEFKLESAKLVLNQGYTVRQACKAVGVSQTNMRRWMRLLESERSGITPKTGKALTPEQRKIQELEAKIRQIEREKDILKKATALLMSDVMR